MSHVAMPKGQQSINSITQELRVIDGSFRHMREKGENEAVPDAIKHLRERSEKKVVRDTIKNRHRHHLILKDLGPPLRRYKK
jgi:hypothetical protein